MTNLTIVNPDDKDFYSHLYHVSFDVHCPGYLVYQDNPSDAIDELADYFFDNKYMGYFLEPDDPFTQELKSFGEVSYVGNFGLPVWSVEISVAKVK